MIYKGLLAVSQLRLGENGFLLSADDDPPRGICVKLSHFVCPMCLLGVGVNLCASVLANKMQVELASQFPGSPFKGIVLVGLMHGLVGLLWSGL